MQGKLDTTTATGRLLRSIPAYAGQTAPELWLRGVSLVYPRVCRANAAPAGLQMTEKGLSPRMQGKPAPQRRDRRCRGSIPAYAGQTQEQQAKMCLSWVYPRVCRANSSCGMRATSSMGLSPRMQGKQFPKEGAMKVERSIPAYAGQTPSVLRVGMWCMVYPRVCRANFRSRMAKSNPAGLSPRMQGKHPQATAGKARPGSIPAYAGQTLRPRQEWCTWTVYPRVCRANSSVTLIWK